jgi:hypothetical protein
LGKRSQTIQPATAIIKKSIVHTGAKTLSGGFHDGFLMVLYQVLTEKLVKNPPKPAEAKHMKIKIMREYIGAIPHFKK